MASPLLEKRMQQLSVDIPDDKLLVDADTTRLAQVFQNLVTNASKYSDPRTHVAVRVRATDDEITVTVADEGIGISDELMPRLFEMFVQGERALDRAEGGLGIGLTIARSLLEMHGGTIRAESPGVGKGSTFTVTLPRSARPRVDTEAMAPLRMLQRTEAGTRVLIVTTTSMPP
jgi:signal transduction histidine kinase